MRDTQHLPKIRGLMADGDGDLSADPRREQGSFVQSLERGMAVLSAFGADAPQMTIADAARRTGLTRAAARRSLRTLQELGYLIQNDGHFALTPKVLDLAGAYLSSTNLERVARPHMERLVQETQESSSLGVLDFPDVVYAVHVPAYRIESFVPGVGARMPAYVNSMGRVLLAEMLPEARHEMLSKMELIPYTPRTITDVPSLELALATVRAQGWSIVDQEFSEGVRSIAAPVLDRDGKAIGAINVTSNVTRTSASELLDRHLPLLLDTTAAVRAEMQGGPRG
jgi:IclR family pca regulon transcriptional regulator